VKTTPDAETPIFRELHEELGELPEIDIHDFDKHAFDFLREYDEQKSSGDQVVGPDSRHSAGRRRKES
jgi:hypothetical protein